MSTQQAKSSKVSAVLDTSHLKVKFPFKSKYGNYINGKFVEPKSGKYFDNPSPKTKLGPPNSDPKTKALSEDHNVNGSSSRMTTESERHTQRQDTKKTTQARSPASWRSGAGTARRSKRTRTSSRRSTETTCPTAAVEQDRSSCSARTPGRFPGMTLVL